MITDELTWSPPNRRGISYAKSRGHLLEAFAIEQRGKGDRFYPFTLAVKTPKLKYYKKVGRFKTRLDAEREARTMEKHQIVSRTY